MTRHEVSLIWLLGFMMMRLPHFVALVSALVAGGGAYGNDFADTPIFYHLCDSDVDAVQMHVEGEEVRITVKLTEGAAEEFAYLTEINIGKNFIVLAGKSELFNALLRSRIESGRVVSGPLTASEARELFNVVEHLPRSPCGIAKQGYSVDAEPAARPPRN